MINHFDSLAMENLEFSLQTEGSETAVKVLDQGPGLDPLNSASYFIYFGLDKRKQITVCII